MSGFKTKSKTEFNRETSWRPCGLLPRNCLGDGVRFGKGILEHGALFHSPVCVVSDSRLHDGILPFYIEMICELLHTESSTIICQSCIL
jgi:hypothetical protein